MAQAPKRVLNQVATSWKQLIFMIKRKLLKPDAVYSSLTAIGFLLIYFFSSTP